MARLTHDEAFIVADVKPPPSLATSIAVRVEALGTGTMAGFGDAEAGAPGVGKTRCLARWTGWSVLQGWAEPGLVERTIFAEDGVCAGQVAVHVLEMVRTRPDN